MSSNIFSFLFILQFLQCSITLDILPKVNGSVSAELNGGVNVPEILKPVMHSAAATVGTHTMIDIKTVTIPPTPASATVPNPAGSVGLQAAAGLDPASAVDKLGSAIGGMKVPTPSGSVGFAAAGSLDPASAAAKLGSAIGGGIPSIPMNANVELGLGSKPDLTAATPNSASASAKLSSDVNPAAVLGNLFETAKGILPALPTKEVLAESLLPSLINDYLKGALDTLSKPDLDKLTSALKLYSEFLPDIKSKVNVSLSSDGNPTRVNLGLNTSSEAADEATIGAEIKSLLEAIADLFNIFSNLYKQITADKPSSVATTVTSAKEPLNLTSIVTGNIPSIISSIPPVNSTLNLNVKLAIRSKDKDNADNPSGQNNKKSGRKSRRPKLSKDCEEIEKNENRKSN